MRNRDEDFLTMTSVTLQVLDNNKTTWENHAGIKQGVESITDAAEDIKESQQGYGATVTTGYTKDKGAASDNAIDAAVELAGYTQVYARRTNNLALLDQMKEVTRRKLEKTEDTALVAALEDVYSRVNTLGNVLEVVGVTVEVLSDFRAAIDLYDSLKDSPRNVIVTRKGERTTQSQLLSLLRTEWKDLDRLMQRYRKGNPKFLTDYQNARIIVNRSGGRKGGEQNRGTGQ